jgi:hypothetical protein
MEMAIAYKRICENHIKSVHTTIEQLAAYVNDE